MEALIPSVDDPKCRKRGVCRVLACKIMVCRVLHAKSWSTQLPNSNIPTQISHYLHPRPRVCGVARPAPEQAVGLCGSLRLDGRTSSGAASRTLSTFWNVSAASTSASAEELSTVQSALAAFDGSLLAELNATVLAIGVEFTFSLTVGSFLGEAGEASATVTRT